MTFAVAPQTVPLADNASMVFEVDPLDSAVVHLSMLKADGTGHRMTFARNGAYTGVAEVKAPDDPDKAPTEGVQATGAKAADEDEKPHTRGRHR